MRPQPARGDGGAARRPNRREGRSTRWRRRARPGEAANRDGAGPDGSPAISRGRCAAPSPRPARCWPIGENRPDPSTSSRRGAAAGSGRTRRERLFDLGARRPPAAGTKHGEGVWSARGRNPRGFHYSGARRLRARGSATEHRGSDIGAPTGARFNSSRGTVRGPGKGGEARAWEMTGCRASASRGGGGGGGGGRRPSSGAQEWDGGHVRGAVGPGWDRGRGRVQIGRSPVDQGARRRARARTIAPPLASRAKVRACSRVACFRAAKGPPAASAVAVNAAMRSSARVGGHKRPRPILRCRPDAEK